jgi:hypothetical protein
LPAFDREDILVLAARRKRILAKLQTISDARAAALSEKLGKPGAADSSPPPETDMDCIGKDGPPSKDFSLWAHYDWRFKQADRDAERARKVGDAQEFVRVLVRMSSLCEMATRDYCLHTGVYRRPQGDDTGLRAVERLQTEYEGCAAEYVATWEMCSVRWVRQTRLRNGMDPETGERRPPDERTARILALAERKLTQREIALEVGVSAMTVSRTLRGSVLAAA